MLRFGIVTQINPKLAKARVNFGDDDLTSFWLPVLQSKTLKDKFYSMPDINEQVACLMDENSEDGVILGAIYSNEDISLVESEKQVAINFENGSFINADKEKNTLTINFENIKLVGNIEHEGSLTNTEGITSNADITDKTSSMDSMRGTYNSHTHPDNNKETTSKMQ